MITPLCSAAGQPRSDQSLPFASILLLTVIFYLNFLPRLIMAPLMVIIEKELQIGHGEAGSFFLLISAGYCITFLFSGFIASKLTHHITIVMSSVAVGFMLIIISVSHSVLSIKIELFFLGVAAAPYFPSGLWLITSLTRAKQQGKAIAIHELAPSLSFISAPIIAEIFLRYGSWRILLACLGILSILMGWLNIILGIGKGMKGEPASFKKMKLLMKEPSFQIMCCLFVLGMGASIGLYTMMPLFLVNEHLFERGWANSIVSLSRLPGIATVLVAGFALDRFGIKGSLLTVLLSSGVLIITLGAASGHTVVFVLFLQYMAAVCFFPAAWMAVSRLNHPDAKGVALTLAVPIAYIFGAGFVPATIGMLGEYGFFSLGFIGFGVLVVVGGLIVPKLRLSAE